MKKQVRKNTTDPVEFTLNLADEYDFEGDYEFEKEADVEVYYEFIEEQFILFVEGITDKDITITIKAVSE